MLEENTHPPSGSREDLIAALAIFLLALALFSIGLGETSLWDSDEPLYTEIAREMAVTGDWLNTRWNCESWYCHPPLYFWLTALAGTALGWTESAARIWSAIFGAASVAVTYLIGAAAYDRRIARKAAIIMGTSLHVFAISRLAILDTSLVFFLTAALYFFILHELQIGREYATGFWICCALATLAKGPFGFFFPTGIVFLYLLARRELHRIGELRPWPGLLLYLAIAAPWYIAGSLVNGSAFNEQVFGFFIFKRIVSPILNQGGPWHYYLPILAAGFLPWVAFLPQAIAHLVRQREKPFSLLFVMWTIPTLVFFSVAGTKLPNYILIMYPAMAICAAVWLDALAAGEVRGRSAVASLLLIALVTAAVFICVAAFGRRSHPEEFALLGGELTTLSLAMVTGYSLALALLFVKRRLVFPTLASANLVVLLLIIAILPKTEAYKPIRPLALQVRASIHEGDTLAVVAGVDGNNSLVFYSGRRVRLLNNEKEQQELFTSGKPFFCMMSRSRWEELQEAQAGALRLLDCRREHCIVTNRI